MVNRQRIRGPSVSEFPARQGRRYDCPGDDGAALPEDGVGVMHERFAFIAAKKDAEAATAQSGHQPPHKLQQYRVVQPALRPRATKTEKGPETSGPFGLSSALNLRLIPVELASRRLRGEVNRRRDRGRLRDVNGVASRDLRQFRIMVY